MEDEPAQDWRWRRVGERGMSSYEARPPVGDLQASGAVVFTHLSEAVGHCQVCVDGPASCGG